MIVGLCGEAGSGKDAVADCMVRNHGFVKVAFADPLKRICRDVYDFTDEQLWGPSEERNKPDLRYHRPHGPWIKGKCACCGIDENDFIRAEKHIPCFLTPRFALQLLGTEWGRTCFPNTWAELALRIADKVLFQSGILRSVFYNYDQKQGLYVTSTPEGPKPRGVVISDVRFRNEVDALHGKSSKVVRIVRQAKGLKGAAGQHLSETEMLKIPNEMFHNHFINAGTGLDLLAMATAGLVDTLARQ